MSFHSSLMGALVLPADLVTAGVVAAAAAVYDGRQPQAVQRQDVEVWVERLRDPETAGTGFQHARAHEYRLHVRARGNAGGNKTGSALLALVESRMQTIKERYDAAVPFLTTFTGMLPARAAEEAVDEEPGDEATLDGSVRVTFWVRE